jgi:hypothetical protein
MLRGGIGTYTPSPQTVRNALMNMQVERIGYIKKIVEKNVFSYNLLPQLLSELSSMRNSFEGKRQYLENYKVVMELLARLQQQVSFAETLITGYYSKKSVPVVYKKHIASKEIYRRFEAKIGELPHVILAFLLLDEVAAMSRTNQFWRAKVMTVKLIMPYCYARKHGVFIQFNHLSEPPYYGDVSVQINAALKANRFAFWKSFIDTVADVPLKLLQLEEERKARSQGKV